MTSMKAGAASSRMRGRTNRLRWLMASASVAALTLFHAAVLYRRIEDASIQRPLVLGRWLFAAALLIAALAVRRLPMRRSGRRAVIVFWLLVALLHLAIPAGGQIVDVMLAAVPAAIVIALLTGDMPRVAPSGARWISIDRLPPALAACGACCGDRAPPFS